MTSPRPELFESGYDIGWQIRALIARHRFTSNTLERNLVAMLRNAHQRAAQELVQDGLRAPTLRQRARLETLQYKAEQYLTAVLPDVERDATRQLLDYAKVERRAAIAQIKGLGNITNDAMLPPHLAVELAKFDDTLRAIPINGVRFDAWWKREAENTLIRFRREMQFGLAQSEHPDVIARRIFALRDARGEFGGAVYKGSRNALRAMVSTMTNAIQNQVLLSTLADAGDSVGAVRADAVRDTGTTLICRNIDGTIWLLNDPAMKVPPYHVRCRTHLTPLANLPEGMVRKQRVDHDEWLRAKPVEYQDRALGKGRAQRWRDHNLTLNQLVDDDFRSLTLAQLDTILTTPFL